MPWIDVVILAILLVSAALSFFSGFIKETISLVALVAAVWVVLTFTADLAPFMPWHTVTLPTARFLGKNVVFDKMGLVLAAGILLLVVLLAGSVANHVASRLVKAASLGGVDRMLGVVFGVFRGAVIVVVLVLLVGLTSIPGSAEWQRARFVGPFESAAHWVVVHLPEQYAQHFSFEHGAVVSKDNSPPPVPVAAAPVEVPPLIPIQPVPRPVQKPVATAKPVVQSQNPPAVSASKAPVAAKATVASRPPAAAKPPTTSPAAPSAAAPGSLSTGAISRTRNP